jgi:Tfp pilus assembly protein PilE
MRKNFTLVEILMVLGLMAILLFIALPAFEKLAKGSGVELAARNLTSKLGMARGYAITKREYVAVLMPTKDTTVSSVTTVLPNDYPYKGYKLCVVSSTSTGTSPTVFTFQRWIPSEKWEFTPNGTAINHINYQRHDPGTDSNITTGTWSTFAHEEVNGVNLSEISSTYANLDNVRGIVFKPTGKMAVTGNRYIAVSESTYNGTSLISTNPKNWIDITIDQFTGRVTYGSE